MFDFLSKTFSSIFSGISQRGKVTESNIQESLQKIQEALLQADVPHEVAVHFVDQVQKKIVGTKLIASMRPGEMFVKSVHDQMLAFLGGAYAQESFTFQIPAIVMVMGLQGSGKTTFLAKLAYFIQKQAEKRGKKRHILLASLDYYRPAAIDQLQILAQQVGVGFYRATSSNVIDGAHEILARMKSGGYELLLLDTAGRLHVDETMMRELVEIEKIMKPKYKYMVLDSMTGQESLKVAQSFETQVGFHYAVLSKMDSDTKGGAAFAFRYTLQKPILFSGIGEKIEDLEIFRPERVVSRILGMGDIATLLENATDKIQLHEQKEMSNVISSGKITLEDFAKQLQMMSKLGSLAHVVKFLPGMPAAKLSPDVLEKGDKELKKFKAIISSMTRKERLAPNILDGSRKMRVAKGSGVLVQDVNLLLERFEQSKRFVKLFKNTKF